MSNEIRQMVVLPYDMQGNEASVQNPSNEQNSREESTRTNRITNRSNPMERQSRILKIALKLANVNGFNENLNILDENGEFVQDSNLAKLLNITQTKIRNVKGMNELIKLFSVAQITPDLIVNEMVKQRLYEINNDNRRNDSHNGNPNTYPNINRATTPKIPYNGDVIIDNSQVNEIQTERPQPVAGSSDSQSYSNKRKFISGKRRHSAEKPKKLKTERFNSVEETAVKPWQIPFNDEDDSDW